MTDIKIIKTEKDYQDALALISELMAKDPEPESEEGERLSLLATLVADYESKTFPITLPDPIDAIKFRMEQAGLKPADLIPYIGSRSRVSEILSGKRTLTIEMIRSLEAGLGIPAKALLKKPNQNENYPYEGWDTRLLKEMSERGYFGKISLKNSNPIELVKNFFSFIGTPAQLTGMLRQSSYRSSPLTDKRALAVWSIAVLKKAKKVKISTKYKDGVVNYDFMKNLAKLSIKENGPIVAREYLKKYGIILIIEPHFIKTYLDGATILIDKNNPIIGLTLRYDRLDNFWFTLMHELAHIALHYSESISLFYDEIEDIKGLDLTEKEQEADKLAQEALLPEAKWEVSPAKLIPSFIAANSLAKELGVHVAIIAGQIRHRGKKYVYLNKIVNEQRVQKYFPGEKWKK